MGLKRSVRSKVVIDNTSRYSYEVAYIPSGSSSTFFIGNFITISRVFMLISSKYITIF